MKKTIKYPVFQSLDKPEQTKLLPIIQIAERPKQSKTRLKISIPISSIIPESLGHHDKVIPVSDYTIPKTMSEHDSISRVIRRKRHAGYQKGNSTLCRSNL